VPEHVAKKFYNVSQVFSDETLLRHHVKDCFPEVKVLQEESANDVGVEYLTAQSGNEALKKETSDPVKGRYSLLSC